MYEQSVLQPSEIPDIVSTRYGYSSVEVVKPMWGGSANLWSLACDGEPRILKEFQSSYSLADVEPEPRIVDAIAGAGLPVASLIQAVEGAVAWAFRNRVFHLQVQVVGWPFENNQAPTWLMARMSRDLSTIHENMPNQALPNRWPTEWFTFDIPKLDR